MRRHSCCPKPLPTITITISCQTEQTEGSRVCCITCSIPPCKCFAFSFQALRHSRQWGSEEDALQWLPTFSTLHCTQLSDVDRVSKSVSHYLDDVSQQFRRCQQRVKWCRPTNQMMSATTRMMSTNESDDVSNKSNDCWACSAEAEQQRRVDYIHTTTRNLERELNLMDNIKAAHEFFGVIRKYCKQIPPFPPQLCHRRKQWMQDRAHEVGVNNLMGKKLIAVEYLGTSAGRSVTNVAEAIRAPSLVLHTWSTGVQVSHSHL